MDVRVRFVYSQFVVILLTINTSFHRRYMTLPRHTNKKVNDTYSSLFRKLMPLSKTHYINTPLLLLKQFII